MPKKPSPKTLKNKADKLWSFIIRSEGFCRRCGRQPGEITLQAAHIISRSYTATRWDLRNGLPLCLGCHHFAHNKPLEFEDFVLVQIGATVYAELRELALGYTGRISRVDYEELVSDLQARWNEIEEAA